MFSQKSLILMGLVCVCYIPSCRMRMDNDIIPHKEVANWAMKFGVQMWEIGKQTTRSSDIQERYERDATVEKVDGLQMVRQMAEDVENMMAHKMEAVRRIMDVAEHASIAHQYDPNLRLEYHNAKRLNRYSENGNGGITSDYPKALPDLTLTPSHHFGNIAVNFSLSSVHVPTNVYDGAPDVKNAIKWSEHLNRIFASNYELDPSLSWQYFGSAHGFMRQYPATKWPVDDNETDLFDCRVRPWYIQAAASPKDMIILVDTSGSMTGVRREIAKHVVITLLDTLSDNDFVNIYTFNGTLRPIEPCFEDKLVQVQYIILTLGALGAVHFVEYGIKRTANMENVRRLKGGLDILETTGIANFTSALSTAFEILHKYNRSHQGSQCNQAIMVVTDGAPSGYKEVFERYNWPHKPVRVFTYLIGREVTDTDATKWMACANKGYFVHVTTPAEVREQVLKYIPVLARPMVMYQKEHPLIWTPVYADIADPKVSDWMWEVRERSRQRNRTERYKQLARFFQEIDPRNTTTPYQMEEVQNFLAYGKWNLDEMEMRALQMDRPKDVPLSLLRTNRDVHEPNRQPARNTKGEPHAQALITLPRLRLLLKQIQARMSQTATKYRLITSVATPVFDRKNYTNITERTLINDAVWVERIRTVRTANLLGVAGTDVPISDITKLTPSYKLGVNGYAFAITNNGYLIFHPDFRPVYQDILKPKYNGVDLSEIELVDNDAGPRDNDSMLMAMRREMVDRREGEAALRVRIHYDQMKRATIRRQKYYYRPIQDTPFSLGIALPEDYGHFRVKGEVEISRQRTSGANVSALFQGKNWRVHPDWVYCEYSYDSEHQFANPEEAVLHFVVRTQKPGWKWRSTRVRPIAKDGSKSAGIGRKPDKEAYYCDKDLLQSLIFDAQVTEIFDKRGGVKMTEGLGILMALLPRQGIYQMFGINVVFVATRSGLTRWQDAHSSSENSQQFSSSHPRHFIENNKRTVDEVWYKRAVEQHHVEPDSYVYSVPFDAGLRNDSVVTATHAIFLERNGHKAPAAVVGLQYKHSVFSQTFFNITSTCTGPGHCGKTCKDDALECYVLDNNGFVVISEDNTKTGQFFGDIDGMIMDSLVYYEVYQKIRIYDYQAVCLDGTSHKSDASFLLTPMKYVKWLTHWFMGRMAWMLLQTQLAEILNSNWITALAQEFYSASDDEEMDSTMHASSSPENFNEGNNGYGNEDNNQTISISEAYINRTRPRPCDKQMDLYSLQPDRLKEGEEAKPLKGRLTNCSPSILHSQQCGRSFSAHKIPRSNLLLLVVDTLCHCETRRLSIEPTPVEYNQTQECERLREPLYRQRPGVCISYHPEEEEIKLCGGASHCAAFSYVTLMCVLLFTQVMRRFS